MDVTESLSGVSREADPFEEVFLFSLHVAWFSDGAECHWGHEDLKGFVMPPTFFPSQKPNLSVLLSFALHHVKREDALVMLKLTVQKMCKFEVSITTLQCVVRERKRPVAHLTARHSFSALCASCNFQFSYDAGCSGTFEGFVLLKQGLFCRPGKNSRC